jgi:phosphatidylglycerophosphatase A
MTELPGPDWRKPSQILAFGLGAGASPVAPGTAGSLVGLALYWPLAGLPLAAYAAVLAVLALVGIALCGRASRDLGVEDHPGIVWDEITGMLIGTAGLPLEWPWLLAAFAVFRLLDILKPWPISWLDRRITGGLGIMLDDIAAGIATLAVMQIARLGWPGIGG